MRIVEWDQLAEPERRAALARPAPESRAEVAAQVLQIISSGRQQGDAAPRSYTGRLDSVTRGGLAGPRRGILQARRPRPRPAHGGRGRATATVHESPPAQGMQP